MSDDTRKRGRGGRRKDAPTFRPPPRSGPRNEEEVDDEETWAAAGSPYAFRENTAEVSFFEEGDNTNVDWAPSSSPSSPSFDEEGFRMNVHPRGTAPTDHPTEPGPGSFATSGSLASTRPRPQRGPAGLALPAPRGRQAEPVRPIPPVRRAGQLSEASGRYTAVVTPQAGARPPFPGRRPSNNVVGVLVPVAVASVAVFGLAALAINAFQGVEESEIEAPMLPVVGGTLPKTAPPPPFDLVPPSAYRPDLLDPKLAPEDLPTRMAEARAAENAVLAAALSDRAVRLDVQPARFLAHGRMLADVGEVDAALYWLVRAVQERGAPAALFVEDRAFRWLWLDDRWEAFIRWVVVSQRYYSSRGPNVSTILTPEAKAALEKEATRREVPVAQLEKASAKDGLALPVLVWLDDLGGNGDSALPWGQAVADDLGMLVVGLGGPERIGPSAAMWSSDPARDRAQIGDALANIPGFKADPARIYLAGLGQGGQYAVELVLRDPDFAKGALALGPSDTWKGPRDPAAEGKPHPGQSVRIDAGALDPATHTLARLDRGRLMRASITADLRIDAQPWPYGSPPDAGERILSWLTESLGPKKATPEVAAAKPADAAPVVEPAPAPPVPPEPPATAPAPAP